MKACLAILQENLLEKFEAFHSRSFTCKKVLQIIDSNRRPNGNNKQTKQNQIPLNL